MNPIILLHGALGSSTQLQPLARQFEEQGRKVHLLNFSGHSGRAFSKNGFGIEVFANDVQELIDRERIDHADMFGYSMGGYVAIWFAHHHPQRIGKIVTLGTKFDWSPASAEIEVKKMDAEKIEAKVPAFARLLQQRHSPNDWKEVLSKTAGMMLRLGQQPLLTKNILSEIKVPVSILLGDQDDMADLIFSKEVAASLTFGKFRLLPNTPHPIEKVPLDYVTREFVQFNRSR